MKIINVFIFLVPSLLFSEAVRFKNGNTVVPTLTVGGSSSSGTVMRVSTSSTLGILGLMVSSNNAVAIGGIDSGAENPLVKLHVATITAVTASVVDIVIVEAASLGTVAAAFEPRIKFRGENTSGAQIDAAAITTRLEGAGNYALGFYSGSGGTLSAKMYVNQNGIVIGASPIGQASKAILETNAATANAGSGSNMFGLYFNPTLTRPGSGTSALAANTSIVPAAFTGGATTISTSTTLHISGPGINGGVNLSLLVESGASTFVGNVGISTFVPVAALAIGSNGVFAMGKDSNPRANVTPAAEGEIIYHTGIRAVCLSTSASVQSWALLTATTTACN